MSGGRLPDDKLRALLAFLNQHENLPPDVQAAYDMLEAEMEDRLDSMAVGAQSTQSIVNYLPTPTPTLPTEATPMIRIPARRARSDSVTVTPPKPQRSRLGSYTFSSAVSMEEDHNGEELPPRDAAELPTMKMKQRKRKARGTMTDDGGQPIHACPARGAVAAPAAHTKAFVYDDNEGLDEEEGDNGQEAWALRASQNLARSDVSIIQNTIPTPEIIPLPEAANHLLLALATTCDRILLSIFQGSESAVSHLLHTLEGKVDVGQQVSNAMADNSLEKLAARCQMAELNVMAHDFIYSLNCIHLMSAIQDDSSFTHRSIDQILKSMKVPGFNGRLLSKDTLRNYFNDGVKFALLAGAGSIFLLAIAAVAKCRARIRERVLSTDVMVRLYYIIRSPSKGDHCGEAVISRIIPAIAFLRQKHRLGFSSFFSSHFTLGKGTRPEEDISTNLSYSDNFFDSLIVNTVLKPRCKTSWISCDQVVGIGDDNQPQLLVEKMFESSLLSLSTLYAPSASASASTSSTSAPVTINTTFNMDCKANASISGRYRRNSEKSRYEYTEKQRRLAEEAQETTNLEDIKSKLHSFYSKGVKKSNSYIRITHDSLQGRRLRLNTDDHSLLSLILPDLPPKLAHDLQTSINLAFPDYVWDTDSASARDDFLFECLHFSWYNRYALQGKGALPDEEPAAYEQSRVKENEKRKKCQTSQTMPRLSQELHKNAERYEAISQAMQPIFEWLEKALLELLPDEVKIISQFADVLPASAKSDTYPFSGFVINFNVCTKIHRDWKDLCLCVVLVISDHCHGGDLCLEEAGLRFSLNSGDAIVFPSNKLSHFNMHFRGRRVSIVFHTDAAGMTWVNHRNYWDHSLFMVKKVTSKYDEL